MKAYDVSYGERQVLTRIRLELESLRILLQRINKREKLKRDGKVPPMWMHLNRSCCLKQREHAGLKAYTTNELHLWLIAHQCPTLYFIKLSASTGTRKLAKCWFKVQSATPCEYSWQGQCNWEDVWSDASFEKSLNSPTYPNWLAKP